MKCEMCGKDTDGTYNGIPVCFEHYMDGTLKKWLNRKYDSVDTCPECGKLLIDVWSGVQCECGYVFCY